MPKLTETSAKNAQPDPEAGGVRVLWDSELRGFGLRVTRGRLTKADRQAGRTETTPTRTWILNYRTKHDRRERRYSIGRYPDWTAQAAREEAKELLRRIDTGADPQAELQQARGAPTFSDLWETFEREHLPSRRESTRESYTSLATRLLLPEFGRRKLAAITHRDVEAFHHRMARDTPYQANRCLALLSKMFSLAAKWGWRSDNPCKGVERAQESKRERYLLPDELARLTEVLAEYSMLERVKLPRSEWHEEDGRTIRSAERRRDTPHPERLQTVNAIRLMLLTGARKGEVLSARWEQFDTKAGVWTKPGATTKQKTTHRVPLSAPACQLVADMADQAGDDSPYLFPGDTPDTHQQDIKNAWETIRKRAGIEGVRVHDLRHTYAAMLASAGLGLPVIGALLGHTQPQTTHRYAHLMDDPLREATERVGAIVSGGEKAKVTPIRGAK